jgi:hypothetical protein
VRNKHEILLIKDAKPYQQLDYVRYNREFVITIIVITEFDCMMLGAIQIIRDTFLAYIRPPSPMCHLVTLARLLFEWPLKAILVIFINLESFLTFSCADKSIFNFKIFRAKYIPAYSTYSFIFIQF